VGLTTDKDGKYRLNAVPPGEYVLRAFTPEGVQLGLFGHIAVASGKVTEQDVWIDPSGRVYDSVSGLYQQGVRVLLFFDEEDSDEPGKLVPADQLGVGQQGQTTGAQGVYKFDVKPRRKYRLLVESEPAAHAFPSLLIPPAAGFAPPGPVVLHPPSLDPRKSRAYYLRFAPNGVDDDVTNNHVPIDPMTSLVRLEKRADRARAVVGDIVNYTVTVENRSTRNLTAATGHEVWLVDAPARGLSILRGHAAAQLQKGGAKPTVLSLELGGFQERTTARLGGPEITWGPFDLEAGATLTLHYQVVVGLDTRQGSYRNRAILRDSDRVTDLSNPDEVLLRVVDDPVFDQGLLLGRVFCDDDGDHVRDASESGVMGARVYIDSGSYAQTDATGKWHLSRIDSGVHLVKIDAATLPAGSTLLGEASQVVFFTRGLPMRVDFPVTCVSEKVEAFDEVGSIKLSGKTKDGQPPKPPKWPKTSTTVVGDLGAMTAAVDGQPIDLPVVALELAAPPELTLPVTEGAPNLAAPGAKGYDKHKPVFRGKLGGTADKVASYRLSLWRLDAAGEPILVRAIEGQGALADLPWDGLGQDGRAVSPDGVFLAQLQLHLETGNEAASARTSFGVAYGLPSAPEWKETLRGNFFKAGKKPTATAALKQQVAPLAKRIKPIISEKLLRPSARMS
jgi:uncharacterized repeat protein (TIGR01451 family)